MNYLDNSLYPKELIHMLFANGTLTLISAGFECRNGNCIGCPADGLNIFCSIPRRDHERTTIIALLKNTHPEFFI